MANDTRPERQPKTGQPKSSESTRVALAFRHGEPAAAIEVKKRVQAILWFRGYGIPAADRKDLEQEVMAQLWQAVTHPEFRPEGGFWGLVELVTSRRCIDWIRTRKEHVPLDPSIADERQDPLQSTLSRERAQRVEVAVSKLEEPCRELIYLHAGLDMSYREIGLITGKSEGALRIQMYRCIRKVRRILGSLGRVGG